MAEFGIAAESEVPEQTGLRKRYYANRWDHSAGDDRGRRHRLFRHAKRTAFAESASFPDRRRVRYANADASPPGAGHCAPHRYPRAFSRLTATPIATIPATPKAIPTAVSTTAPAASEPVVSEQEMVVNAFAECGGQYSGRDKAFRSRAAASAIADGRQTVANISALVEEHCGGVSGDAATTSVQRAAISTPTPHPTRSISAAATVVPTQTPLPLALGPVGGMVDSGRQNSRR